jgi:hypothetical protein
MRALYRSSFAGPAWDSCVSRPAACGDDAGESVALAVALLELLDVRARVRSGGSDLYTAEVAFGERHFEVTEAGNPRHLQLRTTSEIWHKENALNLLIQRLAGGGEVHRVD